MIPMDLDWIAKVLGVAYKGTNRPVANINTDTRSIADGEVFLAIKGPNFDGHKFVADAQQSGAIAAIVEHEVAADIPQFVVQNSRRALGLLGEAVIRQVQPKTVAITGSVGKTTVKEMTAAILAKKGKVLATKGNFNNDIGVPLTLLRLSQDDEYAVIELGANHLGEIDYTTNLVKPNVAVVCNVAEAHLEGFGDLFGVARAKGEIFNGLGPDGVAVVNADSEFRDYWLSRLENKNVKQFSVKAKLDVWAEDVKLDALARASFTLCSGSDKVQLSLPLPGQHNVMNALIATAVTQPFGVTLTEVADALGSMAPVKGRVNLIEVSSQLTVIDDTYNANVQSVKAAIDLLADIDGHRVLALGDMAELGEHARQYHQEIGEYAKQRGIHQVYTLGVLSRYASDVYQQAGRHFSQRDKLLAQMTEDLSHIAEKTTVVVKGSRSSRMELLVQDLIASGQQQVIDGDKEC